jgi:hypothetical protein
LEKKLKKIQNEGEAMNGTKVPLKDLLTESFMQNHSEFSSFNELMDSGGYSMDADEFEKIPDDEFDQFIKSKTDFDSWEDMQKTATHEYISKKLGF